MSKVPLKLISFAVSLIFIAAHAREFTIGPCQLQYYEPCNSDAIEFYLFTSDSPGDAPLLLDNIDPKVPSHINLTYRNKLIVHGYNGHIDFNATKIIRNGWLSTENCTLGCPEIAHYWDLVAGYPNHS